MRVLVVEDDPLLSLLAQMTLEEAGHDLVSPAYDVAQAISLADAHNFDLALVDINLDGQDEGIDLAKTLLHRFGLHSLFVSGQIEIAKRHPDHAIGILAKPYAPEDLVRSAAIARALIVGELPQLTEIPQPLTLFSASSGLYGRKHD
jgi:DNA-binding response OmpR family regulator